VQLVIVRAGAVDRFWALATAFRQNPDTLIYWDRRQTARRRLRVRTARDRRQGERRKPPPASWDALDFVLVGGPADA
jgi:hypothetical protein